MKSDLPLFCLLLVILPFGLSMGQPVQNTPLTGLYVGQEPPGIGMQVVKNLKEE